MIPGWESHVSGEQWLTAGPFELGILLAGARGWRWEIYCQGERIAEGCNEGVADLDRVKHECVAAAETLALAVLTRIGRRP